ncbi:MAG: DUF3592 domain-containing protein [Prosthecobacter sp.]|uniref:DUF3592 domain-containing protein n=1 Tax=Prosthecobacter sp. TaxID=1965333 RepID=UPI003903F697
METPTKIKLFAAIAVIAGPFLTYNGHLEKERLAKLEKEGVTVDGMIGGGESRRSGKRSRSYNFDVTFTPQGGAPVTKTFKVTSSFFSARTNDTSVTDPLVKVRYLAANAQDSAIIVDGSDDDALMFPVGIGAFAVGLITLIVMFMRKG